MTTLILINSNKEHHHNTDAATTSYQIKVPKISVVSIYVSGNGVEKLSSTNYEDTYLVEEGTDVDIAYMEEQLGLLSDPSQLENLLPTEGITFLYKGKLYKLTGYFQVLNNICGYFKYKK